MRTEGSQDSQSGLTDALTGDVPLNLGLVDPIDTGPHKGPTNAYGPESVSPQWVWVKAGAMVEEHATEKCSMKCAFHFVFNISEKVTG